MLRILWSITVKKSEEEYLGIMINGITIKYFNMND